MTNSEIREFLNAPYGVNGKTAIEELSRLAKTNNNNGGGIRNEKLCHLFNVHIDVCRWLTLNKDEVKALSNTDRLTRNGFVSWFHRVLNIARDELIKEPHKTVLFYPDRSNEDEASGALAMGHGIGVAALCGQRAAAVLLTMIGRDQKNLAERSMSRAEQLMEENSWLLEELPTRKRVALARSIAAVAASCRGNTNATLAAVQVAISDLPDVSELLALPDSMNGN